jgi:hypothetical protein
MYGRMKEEDARLEECWVWVRTWDVRGKEGEERRVRKGR